MAKSYSYVALDKNGLRTTGIVDAASETAARSELVKRGLMVEAVQEGLAGVQPRTALQTHLAGPILRPSLDALITFFRQLASMYRAGVPLVQSLETLANSTTHPRLRECIIDMREHVVQGKTMSESMERYPEVFSALQVNIIRAGEQGGILDKSLQQLSDYLAKEIKFRNEIKSRTFYPKAVLVIGFIILVVANFLIGYFSSSTGGPAFFLESPLLNPAMLTTLLVLGGGLWLLFRFGPQHDSIRKTLHRLYLTVPYFGATNHMLAMSKFGRAFSSLYSAGVPIGKAIRLAADSCGNEYIRSLILPSAAQIEEGRSLGEAFAATNAFSPIALDMASTGERTGNLDGMLSHMADQYEQESEVRLDKSLKTLGIAIVLLVLALFAYTIIKFYMSYVGGIMRVLDE